MKSRKFILVAIAFIIIEVITFLYVKSFHEKEIAQYLDVQTKELEVKRKSVQNTYSLLVDNIFYQVINRPEVLKLFSKAHNADSFQKSIIRDSLLNQLKPIYNYLKLSNIKQFHFHLPNNESFLRFHRPGKFGDNLTDVRYSVKMTNLKKESCHGFEEGRIYNGFRNVFPLFYDSKHIGSVEISFSFEAIRSQLQQHENNIYGFMLKKDIVGEKVFESEKGNYIQSLISVDYLHEKKFLHYNSDSLKVLQQIDKAISSRIGAKLANNENFTVYEKVDGVYYLISFVVVNNVQGIPVAYVFSYKKDKAIPGFIQQYYITQVSSFVVFLTIMLLFLLFMQKSDKVLIIDEEYKQILDANNDIVFMVDILGTQLFFSSQVEELLGYNRKELIGKSFAEFVPSSEISKHLGKLKEVFLKKQISPFETFALHKEGHKIPVEIVGKIMKYKGKTVGVGTIRDIRNRKKAELDLKESEEKFRAIYNNSPNGFALSRIEDGEVIEINDSFTKISGYTKSEIVGKDAREINIWSKPDDRNRFIEAMRKDGFVRNIEVQLRHKSGKMIDVMGGGAIIKVGNSDLMATEFMDISKRKKIEQDLKESEGKFRAISGSANDGIILMGNSGEITFWNNAAERIFGYTESEILGKDLHEILTPEKYRDRQNKAFSMFKETGEGDAIGRTLELEAIRKNKDVFPVELSLSAIKIKDKWNAVGIVKDITDRKKAEQALKENEDNLRTLFNAMTDVVFEVDYNGTYINIAPTSTKLMYKPPSEIIGKTFHELFPKYDADVFLQTIQSCLDEKNTNNIEYALTINDKEIWFEGRAIPKTENSVLFIARDITIRKKAEQALIKQTEKYNMIADNINDFIWMLDFDMNLVYTSRSCERFIGYTVMELNGMQVSQIHTPKSYRLMKLVLKTAERNIKNNIKGPKYTQVELEYIHKDGHIIIAEVVGHLIYDKDGKPYGIGGVSRNITNRKKAEQALVQSEERLKMLINSVPDIICFKDGEGRWLIANDADLKLFNLEGVDYVGKKDSDLAAFSPFYYDAFMGCEQSDEVAWNVKGISRGVEIIPSPEEEDYIYDIIKVPIFNEDNTRNALVVFGRNITEMKHIEQNLKESELELRKSNDTKDKFFSIIAHDLKSPFNSLVGFSRLLKDNHLNYNEEERDRFINILYQASKNTFKLLENLLTWSRLQSGNMEFFPEKINMKIVVYETMLLLKSVAEKKNIKLLYNTDHDLFVNADINMAKTILRNLVTNAIKFTNINGTISIATNEIKDQNIVEVSVLDTGVGIAKSTIEDLFQIDKDISTRGTADEKGTGLGLILCKEFVEKHGGKIWAESKIDKGSTFTFTLPMVTESN